MNEIMKTLTLIHHAVHADLLHRQLLRMNFFSPSIPLGNWTGRAAFVVTLVA